MSNKQIKLGDDKTKTDNRRSNTPKDIAIFILVVIIFLFLENIL